MALWIGLDAEQFATKAGDFVEASTERNLVATILGGVQTGRYDEAIFAVATDTNADVTGVAVRTPPQNIILAGDIPDPDAFIAAWLNTDPAPPGVTGDPHTARPIAAAWAELTGGQTHTQTHEALHVLTELIPPEPKAPGHLRAADFRQTAQLGEWGIAFAIDAGLPHPSSAGVEHQLSQQRLYVWEVDGQTVSLIGHSLQVAGTVRIGPVYTPQTLRGHGYATAATAALTRRLLDAGAERCALYTDLANPISNHIYAKIGYVRVADQEVIAFLDAAIPE